jgi:hypothetical protein
VLDALIERLKAARRRQPFADVQRAEITAAGLNAIAADPVYARAWGRGWRALRHGLDSDRNVDRLWIGPSWEIYERWCFVRLLRGLQDEASQWDWQRRANGRELVGHLNGRRALLSLQPTFASYPMGTSRRSLSRERVPDLMFSVESGGALRFVIMDAKYRTSRESVLDAMASAHIYQDSLRMGTRRPEASLLLVPRGGGAPWLEEPECHATHRLGVHVFSPESAARLPPAVAALLAEE